MAETLRPCPFCGGEAKMGKFTYESDVYDEETLGYVDTVERTEYAVMCQDCECSSRMSANREMAANSWNRRAERTCRIVRVQPGWWECDACGRSIRWDLDEPPHVHYCPRCGARAVDDDADR